MSTPKDYAFYVNHLRFIAGRTERDTPAIAAMMEELDRAARGIAAEGRFTVPAERLRVAARALAGVAGVLQQHVLPEAVASGDTWAQVQVRWVIDTSMGAVADLTTHAELTHDAEARTIELPAPPTP